MVVVLNTGCASYCLSSLEGSYNNEMKEFVDTNEGIEVNGYKIDNFTYKEVQGTLYSFEDCLKGEGRLLHVFIYEINSDQLVRVFEDNELVVHVGEKVKGTLNFVPYFVAEEKEVHDPDEIIQINISQLFICHGAGYSFVRIVEEGKEYSGGLDIDQKERSSFVSGLIKSGYIITIPVDIVITPPLLIIAGVASLF